MVIQQHNFLSRTINIMFLNIQSLKKKVNEVALLCKLNEVDVMVINETWLKENEEQYYKLPGFNVFFNSRVEG